VISPNEYLCRTIGIVNGKGIKIFITTDKKAEAKGA
jgi:hypothetical protein